MKKEENPFIVFLDIDLKKALIITYYWPPSGGSGVQRWLKFVKYLPENGWLPIVVVPKNPEYPVFDDSLLKDIPNNVKVLKFPIWEPYSIFKKLTGRKRADRVNTGLLFDEIKKSITEKISLWIRGNLLLPDPRVFWIRPTVRQLKKYLIENSIDVIITTGPPHSVHLIGLKLKTQSHIPWVCDFRDHWANMDMLEKFYISTWAAKKQNKLQQKVLDNADLVLTVSNTWAEELQALTKTPVKSITNGYDEDDFKKNNSIPVPGKFVICHGGIINSYRYPDSLWSAFEELSLEDAEFDKALEIQIFGITDDGFLNTLRKYPNVFKNVKINGYIQHLELIKQYSKSDCLLLLLNDTKNSEGHIPGKLFEYLAANRPIIAFGPVHSDVGKIIKDLNAGFLLEYSEGQKIKEIITSIYLNSKNVISELNKDLISSMSRRSLTAKLVSYLEKLNHIS